MKSATLFMTVLTISILFFGLTGCVRVSGGAGYWHKGAEDEAPTVKQVGFDTDDLVHPNKTPGSIEIPAS